MTDINFARNARMNVISVGTDENLQLVQREY
jgi:hypothetical protein